MTAAAVAAVVAGVGWVALRRLVERLEAAESTVAMEEHRAAREAGARVRRRILG